MPPIRIKTTRATTHFVLGMLYTIIVLLFILVCVKTAHPQTGLYFDPHPDELNAQGLAEMRYLGGMLGLMAPPIGWNCHLQSVDFDLQPVANGMPGLPVAYCEPDPALLAEQEREYREWVKRFTRRSHRRR